MAEKNTYNFGLYGRCTVCKEITLEVCEGCDAKDSFTDSSKPGIVICTKCNMEHSIECDKVSCNHQIKVLKTPKNEDERSRIDEFIYRKQHKDQDNRKFIIKESPKKATVVKEVEVPLEDKVAQSGIIKLDAGMEELLASTRKGTLEKTNQEPELDSESKSVEETVNVGLVKEDFVEEEKTLSLSSVPEEEKEDTTPIAEVTPIIEKGEAILDNPEESEDVSITPESEKKDVLNIDSDEISIDKDDEQEDILLNPELESEKLDEEEIVTKDDELPSEVKQELNQIKDLWNKESESKKAEKKEEERRIVNQFYDEQDDNVLDKKINFESIYNETSYFDCKVCGKEETKIICDQCGQSNQFSLNYDALTCKCGNPIKVQTCECGAKHGHSDFYLISEGIKWQYSKSKSYYNYRKGRLLVFATCPTCNVLSVEKCKVCGSKVNFGAPNKNNEVYCKNCGTVNQFICENRNCEDSVKALKNPSSIEDKLDLLNEVMNFKTRVNEKKVKYSEPGSEKKVASSTSGVSIGNVSSTPDFTNSFIEEFDSKTKDMITNSFIEEVETEVNQRKKMDTELRDFNKSNFAPRAPGISLGGAKSDDEDEEESVISFDDSGKGSGFIIIIIVIILALGAGGWWAYNNFIMKKSDPVKPQEVVVEKPVVEEVAAVADSTVVVTDSTAVVTDSAKVVEEVSAEAEKPIEDK